MATGGDDKTCKVWKIESGNEIFTFFGHTALIKSIAVSPKGNYIASGGSDKII